MWKINMLTQVETRLISWLYKVGCKHCMTPFTWTEERMILKLKPKISFVGTIWNWFISILILFSIMFEIKQMQVMIRKRELNGAILTGTLLMGQFGHLSCKLNTSRSKGELLHVINQVFQMNSNWGTDWLHILKKSKC